METENQENLKKDKPVTLLDLILVFLKWKKPILIITSIVLIISVVLYFFVFNLIYFSSATVKSTTKSGGLLSSLEGLPDIGALDDFGMGAGRTARELALYEEILSSRRCLEPLIVKFGLMQRENYRYMEDAIKGFRDDQLSLEEERISGILIVGVFDKDPAIAKEMVEFLLSELDKINIEMNVKNARNNREFIESRYYQAINDLTSAEDTLKSFQTIYGVAPDLQIKAAAQSAFTLEAELKTEEVKLDILKKILSPDQLEVKTQEAKINSLRNRINEIRNSTDLNDFLSLGNSPQIAMSFLRLQRNVEIQTKILTFLLPIYEQAKIEEKRETPTILVLDQPYIAERKTKPKRLTMVVIWTFVGFILTLSIYMMLEYFRNRSASDPVFNMKISKIASFRRKNKTS